MLIQYHRCDWCENTTEHTINVVVGWSTCPAGGPSEPDYESFDLCGACLKNSLQSFLDHHMELSDRKKWAARSIEKRNDYQRLQSKASQTKK